MCGEIYFSECIDEFMGYNEINVVKHTFMCVMIVRQSSPVHKNMLTCL